MTLSNILYKIEEKQNHKFEDDNDSIYSAEDPKDALILSVNSPNRFIHLQVMNCFKISNKKILGRCTLPTTKRWRFKGREMSTYKL